MSLAVCLSAFSAFFTTRLFCLEVREFIRDTKPIELPLAAPSSCSTVKMGRPHTADVA